MAAIQICKRILVRPLKGGEWIDILQSSIFGGNMFFFFFFFLYLYIGLAMHANFWLLQRALFSGQFLF